MNRLKSAFLATLPTALVEHRRRSIFIVVAELSGVVEPYLFQHPFHNGLHLRAPIFSTLRLHGGRDVGDCVHPILG